MSPSTYSPTQLVLTFTDNEQWRYSITAIKIDGQFVLNVSDIFTAGQISITLPQPPTPGNHVVVIEALGYADVTVNATYNGL
ncbi:hemoblobin-interacting domain-containing protein [Brevibacillus fluminis]|uniref:hemoblobin-interacting domain-containing protein n=1 Tax=Brevibacillus fluminis TaxID=511487 RepID=UPI003F89158C